MGKVKEKTFTACDLLTLTFTLTLMLEIGSKGLDFKVLFLS